MNSSSPVPPVAFKDHCSIMHNNTLYVYSPTAFQTLELAQGAQWKQQTNGVAVTGGVCVKGGVDGDNSQPAFYVVGGSTSATNYTGIQRYSIYDKSWTTITPISQVTSQRLYHGAAYLNASSSIVVYAGSQNGNTGPSTETFLMLMYPPYQVQAYSSHAPPTVNPILLPFDNDRAVMVGGSSTNQAIYMFNPDTGFTDLGLALPNPLPDKSVAQSTLVTLDDNSKILLTIRTDQSPNTVTRSVLLNPGNLPAVYGETAGGPASSAAASTSTSRHRRKRTTILSTYPAYNSTDVSSTTRSNFALAQGSNELTAIVGGDSSNSIIFFDKFSNSWKAASNVVGAQKPLTTLSTMSPTTSPTVVATVTPSPSPSSTGVANGAKPSNGLAVLGGVLGAICGIAAILIIILLWLRTLRRKKMRAATEKSDTDHSQHKMSFEEQGLQPLSRLGQPMGRSPVPSTIPDTRDSAAMFGGSIAEKSIEAGGSRSASKHGSSLSFGQNPFRRQQQASPLTISKPMLADLGDYQERPSIELGKATPVAPMVATSPLSNNVSNQPEPTQKADQRKTDEGWAQYFAAGTEAASGPNRRDTAATALSEKSSSLLNAPRRGNGGGAFWPGPGLPEPSPRSPKNLRDSKGRTLTARQVAIASPNLQAGPSNPQTATMSAVEGIPGHISSGESMSSDASVDEDDDDYEDERMIAYSSGVPSVHETAWTPMGSNRSGPSQRPMRPPSASVGPHDFSLPTSMSNQTDNSETSKSSIPAFPMPSAAIRKVRPGSEVPRSASITPAGYHRSEDYFRSSAAAAAVARSSMHNKVTIPQGSPDISDMSWVNLGTVHAPAELPANSPVGSYISPTQTHSGQ